jgi:hypothetical protein
MSKLISPYSLIKKGSKEYREALRSIRRNHKKYGAKFDNSELWNLDNTIYKYVNLYGLCEHPFLKECISNNVGLYNNYWKQQGVTKEEYNKNCKMYWEKEEELYKEVNLQISKLTDKKFLDFLLPRLKAFKDKTIGYPVDMTFEQYEEYLQSIIDEIETKGTCTLIYENFNELWN